MEYRRIEYFLKAAEILNFTEAAKKLFITPQALTRQVSVLEAELGARLFDRTTRYVRLTDFGRECYSRFSVIKRDLDSAFRDMLILAKDSGEVIRIGFFSALPKNEIITPLLNLFSRKTPELKIEISSGNMDEIREWLASDEIDICITNTHDYENWREFETIDLLSAPADIVVAPSHPWAKKREVTEQDIESGSILLLKLNRPLEPDSFYRTVPFRRRRYAQNFDSMLVMLETGNDFAVFPRVFNHMFHADFIYFDLPDKLKFQFHTICAFKKTNKKRKHFEFLSDPYLKNIINL